VALARPAPAAEWLAALGRDLEALLGGLSRAT